jgi:stage II sporulation protein D
MERWNLLAARIVAQIRQRPRTVAGFASAGAVLVLGLGLWSCQTAPAVTRAPIPDAPLREPDVRVRIKNGVDTVKLEGPPELTIQPENEPAITLATPLIITATSDGLILKSGGRPHAHPSLSAIDIQTPKSAAGQPPSRIRVDGRPYAGTLRIVPKPLPAPAAGQPTGSAKLDVIETVALEMYLAGVLPAELPTQPGKAFHAGAFPVQAIAARTYALQQRQRTQRSQRPYDLEAGESDQAYLGAPDNALALNGVQQTRGVVLSFNGQLLRAYYSSTCGGRAGSAADVWPTGPGYEYNLAAPIQGAAREHACQASPLYRWTLDRPLAELSTRIREWGKQNGHAVRALGTIASLKVDRTNTTGRPTRYILTDTARASFPINAEHLRNACNFNAAGLAAITMPTRVKSGDIEMAVDRATVTISGRGFGHGVGMCQYCINGMAQKGEPWQTIVLRFYPGAKLERAY